ncbi:hypothetical protein PSYPI_28909 [Pseudomonas syringae pv. pisi str. 1704B]|jgi:hypothetical protein|uniref:Uncharacterized protein n=1 Tax=Pseudomonas syringae pv. pisi str. 1704B TaxID=629263 RepID=F3GGB4_PSESJ|nr:hypothetical protein PSYPI_28909 [Pseudomonas syringae pv. pisi str. 1704B]
MASQSNVSIARENRTRFQAAWASTEPAIEALAVEASEGFFK